MLDRIWSPYSGTMLLAINAEVIATAMVPMMRWLDQWGKRDKDWLIDLWKNERGSISRLYGIHKVDVVSCFLRLESPEEGLRRGEIWELQSWRWLGALWLVGPVDEVVKKPCSTDRGTEYMSREVTLVFAQETMSTSMLPALGRLPGLELFDLEKMSMWEDLIEMSCIHSGINRMDWRELCAGAERSIIREKSWRQLIGALDGCMAEFAPIM